MNEKKERQYDLAERTFTFAAKIIKLCKKMRRSPINDPLIVQLVKAGTSVGANYCEADDAESKSDFKHKIGIVKKECNESKFFLRSLSIAEPVIKIESDELLVEANELHLIFNSIYKKVK